MRRWVGWILGLGLLVGCTGVPEGIKPVQGFELSRYLGDWYEIARLDHSFERGLEGIRAGYSLREDGSVRVVNRGYDTAEGAWREAEGRALFVGDEDIAHLKVSFFGPFYGSYIVFELDPEYRYAFITSSNRQYLWLLSRTPTVSEDVLQHFRETAAANGFAVDELIYVQQTDIPAPE